MREVVIVLLSFLLIAFILKGIIKKTEDEEGLLNKLRAIFGDLL